MDNFLSCSAHFLLQQENEEKVIISFFFTIEKAVGSQESVQRGVGSDFECDVADG